MDSSDFDDFFKRIMNYCALAERCTQDVVQKLTAWNVPDEKMDDIL